MTLKTERQNSHRILKDDDFCLCQSVACLFLNFDKFGISQKFQEITMK